MQFEKVGSGLSMRINSMNDAQDPYELEEDAMGENIRFGNSEIESDGRRYE